MYSQMKRNTSAYDHMHVYAVHPRDTTVRLCLCVCALESSDLQLSALLDTSNLQLVTISLQDSLAVVLPESLGRILSSETLEDLCAAGVLIEEFYRKKKEKLET